MSQLVPQIGVDTAENEACEVCLSTPVAASYAPAEAARAQVLQESSLTKEQQQSEGVGEGVGNQPTRTPEPAPKPALTLTSEPASSASTPSTAEPTPRGEPAFLEPIVVCSTQGGVRGRLQAAQSFETGLNLFSAASTPIFAIQVSFESSRRDLHNSNAQFSTDLRSQMFN